MQRGSYDDKDKRARGTLTIATDGKMICNSSTQSQL